MFDDIIRDKANEHQAPVPPDAWDNIINEKKKRRFAFFWWLASMLLLGITIIGFYLYNTGFKEDKVAVDTKATDKRLTKKEADRITVTQPMAMTEKTLPPENSIPVINSADNETATTAQQKNGAAPDYSHHAASTIESKTPSSPIKKIDAPAKQKNSIERPGTKDIAAAKKTVKKIKGSGIITATPADIGENATATVEEVIAPGMNVVSTNEKTVKENTSQPDKKLNIPATDTLQDKKLRVVTKDKKTIAAAPKNKKQQVTADKKSSKYPWFIEFSAAPVLPVEQSGPPVSFNRTLLLNNSFTNFSGKLIGTSIDPSVAFALDVKKQVSHKIAVALGLQYLQLKENINITGTERSTTLTVVSRLANGSTGPLLVTDTVHSTSTGTRAITATNSYRLLSIPVFVQYNFIQRRTWIIGVTGGLYVNIINRYQNEINRNATAQLLVNTPTSNNKNNLSLDCYAGVRFEKMLGNKLSLFVLPAMRYNINGYAVKGSLVDRHIHQVALNAGFSFKVK